MDENEIHNKPSEEVLISNVNKTPSNKENFQEIELENLQKPKPDREEAIKSILNIYI